MNSYMEIQLLHEQQLVIKNDFLSFFFVAINIRDEL